MQHRCHQKRLCWRLSGHRAAAIKISKQHRRAGPPSRKENYRPDDGHQVLLECPKTDRRNRDLHIVKKGAVALPWWSTLVRSRSVLQLGILIFSYQRDDALSLAVNATQPNGPTLEQGGSVIHLLRHCAPRFGQFGSLGRSEVDRLEWSTHRPRSLQDVQAC